MIFSFFPPLSSRTGTSCDYGSLFDWRHSVFAHYPFLLLRSDSSTGLFLVFVGLETRFVLFVTISFSFPPLPLFLAVRALWETSFPQRGKTGCFVESNSVPPSLPCGIGAPPPTIPIVRLMVMDRTPTPRIGSESSSLSPSIHVSPFSFFPPVRAVSSFFSSLLRLCCFFPSTCAYRLSRTLRECRSRVFLLASPLFPPLVSLSTFGSAKSTIVF